MAGDETPALCVANVKCRCVGWMWNVAANTTPWRFTGVRPPEGQGGAQPGTCSKGGSLPPPPAPRRAQKNKMQDSSMEEGENNTEESGLWCVFYIYFLCIFIIGACIYMNDACVHMFYNRHP